MLRDRAVVQIPSAEVTVGDIVMLEAGDYIPADGRLLECASMKVDESALTGESLGVEKDNDDYKRRKCTTWRPGEYGLFGQFCHLWKRFISCN